MPRLFTPVSVVIAVLVVTSSVRGAERVMVMGTYQKGSNFTEPRPKKSEFLQTIHGGIGVIGSDAAFYLLTKVIKKPEKRLYVRVDYENPDGGSPLQNDMWFEPSFERMLFSAPHFVKGLRSYSNYVITVRIFPSRQARDPIDTLRQTIRSYVDTRGPKAQFYKRLKVKP
jgi:hypothetical protein